MLVDRQRSRAVAQLGLTDAKTFCRATSGEHHRLLQLLHACHASVHSRFSLNFTSPTPHGFRTARCGACAACCSSSDALIPESCPCATTKQRARHSEPSNPIGGHHFRWPVRGHIPEASARLYCCCGLQNIVSRVNTQDAGDNSSLTPNAATSPPSLTE